MLLGPPAAATASLWQRLQRWFARFGRPLLFFAGLAAIVLLIRSVGAEAVLRTLLQAGPWLPAIFALELCWVLVEGGALLVLYGGHMRKIPPRALVVATLIHFSTMMILPVGRAGAEVARATLLSRHVGGGRAAAASTLMQALTLMANSVVSWVCAGFVFRFTTSIELALLLLGNGAATLVLGLGMYVAMRRARLGGFLGRRFARMTQVGPDMDAFVRESRSRHWPALGLCLAGRLVQTLQYGFILTAVVGAFSFSGTFLAQGIHLVGAGLGDVVPNQVGVTEGAYRIFASVLGLEGSPEKAVSLALLARVSTLTVAGLCALALQCLPGARSAPPAISSLGDGPVGS